VAPPENLRMARALAHDVGKYIARTARNVPPGQWSPPLVAMLLADLYDLRGERALQLFLRLSLGAQGSLGRFPAWNQAYDLLCEADAMEAELRVGDGAKLDQAAQLALRVEDTLRQLLHQVQRESPDPITRGNTP
jgi:hypothetical protein